MSGVVEIHAVMSVMDDEVYGADFCVFREHIPFDYGQDRIRQFPVN